MIGLQMSPNKTSNTKFKWKVKVSKVCSRILSKQVGQSIKQKQTVVFTANVLENVRVTPDNQSELWNELI